MLVAGLVAVKGLVGGCGPPISAGQMVAALPAGIVLTFTRPGSRHWEKVSKMPSFVKPYVLKSFNAPVASAHCLKATVFPVNREGTIVASRIKLPAAAAGEVVGKE